MLVLLLIGIGLLVWITTTRRGDIGEVRTLPNGSTFQLVDVVFTATNHTMKYRGESRLLPFLAPILPREIKKRLSGPSADLGGSDFGGITNLIVLTAHHREKDGSLGPAVGWMRVLDQNGNGHEGVSSGGMYNPGAYSICRWNALAFPHRSRTLTLQFLSGSATAGWTNAAEFRIRNPLYARYPQWVAEPLPNTKRVGALAVTLNQLSCSTHMTATNLAEASRTRLTLSFTDNGVPSEDWRIQKLAVSDPTGNRWSPDLNLHYYNWITNGVMEFFGALSPAEQAWKLQFELVRAAGFESNQTWNLRIPLPPQGVIASLTNHWEWDGISIDPVSIAAPDTSHDGDFRSIAKWWGPEKRSVYSLALRVTPRLPGTRLTLVGAVDQKQTAIKILGHRSQDFEQQAVFFKPSADSTEAHFTFALQRSRFVEFLARPEFR